MSNIYLSIKDGYKQALKDRNPLKDFINLVISDINSYCKDNHIEEITNKEVLLILKRIVKKLDETIDYCKLNNREYEEQAVQLKYVSQFIPSLVKGEELRLLIQEAQSKYPNMGDVMKFLNANNADMKEVKSIILNK